MEGALKGLAFAVIIAAAAAGCREVVQYEDNPGGGGGTTAAITWERTAGPGGEAVLSLRSDGAGVVYAGTESGRLYRTVTDGNAWTNLPLPYSGGAVTAILLDAFRTIYVANDVHGIVASADGGANWVPFNPGLADTAVYALAIFPGGTLAAGTASGLVSIVRPGSATWTTIHAFPRAVTSLLPMSAEEFYVAVWGSGVFHFSSPDSAPAAANAGLPDFFVNALHFGAGGRLYAGTRNSGLYRSEPETVFWQDGGGGTVSRNVVALRTSQFGELFAATGTGVFYSTDGGAQWTGPGAGIGIQEVRALSIDENARVYAGSVDGVYRSVRHTTGAR